MNIIRKGVNSNGDEDTKLNVLVSHKEVDDFVRCGQHVGQDNVLFFNKNSIEKEVFLLLHGASNGTVTFEGVQLTLEEVYHKLQHESVFNILKSLDIKYIQVLCCFGGLQKTFKDKDMTIKSYFDNKGVLLGKQTSKNSFEFIPTDLIA